MEAFGSAQGAVDSLLGTLSSVIRDEARLLGGVAGEVQFIKDEMESMNGFLLHVDQANEDGDHQVRAWMTQVRDVAVESERWVGRYQRWAGAAPQGDGLLGFLRRIAYSVWTVRERREIATKVQELKARAQEVGDRRQRYGVEVPKPKEMTVEQDPQACLQGDEAEEQEYALRRCLEDYKQPDITEEDKGRLIRWLKEDSEDMPQVRVIGVIGIGQFGKKRLYRNVFQDTAVTSWFDCKSWIQPAEAEDCFLHYLVSDLEQQQMSPCPGKELQDRVSCLLKDKKFLIVWDGITSSSSWEKAYNVLRTCGGSAGNAMILIMQDMHFLATRPNKSLDKSPDIMEFYRDNAIKLLKKAKFDKDEEDRRSGKLGSLMSNLAPDYFCARLLVHLMYIKPDRSMDWLDRLSREVRSGYSWWIGWIMLRCCYDDLPLDYRRCLLYLSIFPPGSIMRRRTIVRRWIAEGLIVHRAGLDMLDAGERCFSALFDRGLLTVCSWGTDCRVKRFTVPDPVLEFITETARTENFADIGDLPSSLAPYISIGNGISSLQQVSKRRHICNKILRRIRSSENSSAPDLPAPAPESDSSDSGISSPKQVHGSKHTGRESGPLRDIATLLGSLPKLQRQGLVKVLDLVGCEGLQMHHLKIICQIPELRYLSLRSTNVTELPKDIHKLNNLETLDIRETKVKKLPDKIVLLQKLKHLLSGHIEYQPKESTDVMGSYESFSAVHMPCRIGNMTEMQILSHVEVSGENASELIDEFARLQKLRKLGVVLLHGQSEPHHHLLNLLRAVEKLNKQLRSLSIHIDPIAGGDEATGVATNTIKLPMYLEKIKISGFVEGLPPWVLVKFNRLVKITLQNSLLKNSDLTNLIGRLPSLLHLRIWFIDLREQEQGDQVENLVFKKGVFKNLRSLSMEHCGISDLTFEEGAASKLEVMVWSYGSKVIKSLSGINHLRRLNAIDFYGSNVSDEVKQAVLAHPNAINVWYYYENAELRQKALADDAAPSGV